MAKLWMGCGGQVDAACLETYEATGLYVAEPKRDGIWAVCIANGEQRFFSRQGREKALYLPPLPPGTIVVGELGYGSQAAALRAETLGHPFMDIFDMLQVQGTDVSQHDDNQRREILEATWAAWSHEVQTHFPLVPRLRDGFRTLYETESEGIVLKQVCGREHQPYVSNTRNPYWLKVKRRFTVDMVLMDYALSEATSFKGMNLARCVTCGVYQNGELVPLVNVGAFSLDLKAEIVRNWAQYKGRVAEIDCFKVFKSGALRHPSLVRIRTDKAPQECTWTSLIELSR